ncbi:MAG TPA: hypothetical protein PLI43_19550 [Albidovulum sp.]|uniref:hypothetical protein n=1 Tax=Albidovulum sp. TaxID=1872424 RepID=UPI002CF39CDB|nr:hypothetical protein [Albidovulum sp.]
MRRALLTATLLFATTAVAGAQSCAGGICIGTLNPGTGLPRAITGGAPGSARGLVGRNPFDFQTDATGITRDRSGNILPPADGLGLTRTRDGKICARDASGLLHCR